MLAPQIHPTCHAHALPAIIPRSVVAVQGAASCRAGGAAGAARARAGGAGEAAGGAAARADRGD
eukprot:5584104-Prymnesium_polylepis.1